MYKVVDAGMGGVYGLNEGYQAWLGALVRAYRLTPDPMPPHAPSPAIFPAEWVMHLGWGLTFCFVLNKPTLNKKNSTYPTNNLLKRATYRKTDYYMYLVD